MTSTLATIPKPVPRCEIAIRPAAPSDVAFIDALQKMHSHMVGWMPGKQLEKYIAGGHVLVAEHIPPPLQGGPPEEKVGRVSESPATTSASPTPQPSPSRERESVGYCIARDQYMKRDDVGIIYQLNVLPLKQRNLIGASLVKAVFERAAYGCRLFSCWCAQDIQANWFWESIGFVPLAFRTGSRAKQRIHIFWQRRVREDDEGSASGGGGTPYWFPSQTSAGAVGEDRIVLPIPPGTHWRDAKPLVLPGLPAPVSEAPEVPTTLPGGALVKPRPDSGGPTVSRSQRCAIIRSQSKHLKGLPPGKAAMVTAGGIRYIERGDYVPDPDPAPAPAPEKPKRPRNAKPRPRNVNDPKYIAAARELRDRYLEQINTERILPSAWGGGKYDVSRPRTLEAAATKLESVPLLKAA